MADFLAIVMHDAWVSFIIFYLDSLLATRDTYARAGKCIFYFFDDWQPPDSETRGESSLLTNFFPLLHNTEPKHQSTESK
jgi:hypothetical protein